MNKKQVEKLLKRAAETSDILAMAHANLVETNATIVDILTKELADFAEREDGAPRTMQ